MTDRQSEQPLRDPCAEVDARLRAAFEPEPDVAARVTRAALAAEGNPPGVEIEGLPPALRRLRWVGVAAAAAVVILAASLALQPSRSSTSRDQTAAADGVPSLTGSFIDGVLVVSLPDGSVSIMGGGAREDRPPDGYGIVLVEGELR